MKRFLTDIVYRNAYLLILAAWLFTLSFIFSNYWSFSTSPQGVKRTLEKNVQRSEKDFRNFLGDTSLIMRLLDAKATEDEVMGMIAKRYFVFIHSAGNDSTPVLAYWNTQQVMPTEAMIAGADSASLVDLPNGRFEWIRRTMRMQDGRDLRISALIPIRWEYFIENEYLRKGFADEPEIERNYRFTDDVAGIAVQDTEGKVLFRVEKRPDAENARSGWVTVLLRTIAMLLVFFYIHMIAQGLAHRTSGAAGVIFLTLMIIFLRALSYRFELPFDFRQFELFSPVIYGSSALLNSLGDLLVNALLFVWIMLFTQSVMRAGWPWKRIDDPPRKWVLSVFICILLVIATRVTGTVIRSLVADSAISYEVTNFFKLDSYTVVGFFVMGCLSMGYFILSHLLSQVLDDVLNIRLFHRILLAVAIGLAFLTFSGGSGFVIFGIGLLAWLVAYMAILKYSDRQGERRITGTATVFWLLFFSASITAVIFSENRTRELGIRKAAAVKLAMQTDPSSGYLVNIATVGLSSDFLMQNLPRFRDPVMSARLKDSIINASFKGYTNNYETRLYLFDAAGRPLSSDDRLTYDTLNTIFTLQGKKTGMPELRYVEHDFTSFSYIFRREVRDTAGQTAAMFYMLSNPRRFRDDALYPELIRQSGESPLDRWPVYAYAVYDSFEMRVHKNDYPFPLVLDPADIPRTEFRNEVRDGHEVLWHRAGPDKVVIIARKSNFLLEGITLFAYLFCSSLLLVALFQLASFLIRSAYEGNLLDALRNTSIRTQIYGTIIFISIFSFLVIGAVTIIFFVNRYDRNNRDMLSRTIQVMSEELQDRMSGSSMRSGLRDLADSGKEDHLQQVIAEISEIHNADVNLYDDRGDLMVSSQPFVYNEGILSRKMDPLAYYQMSRLRKIQFIQEEKYGQLQYLSIYQPFSNRERQVKAYLNIPYFASTMGLKQEISNFLVALINLNAFIFLMAGVISVFITGKITRSFTWIGQKMQEVNLGRHNQEISWDRKDEIGGLVSQYNLMVRKLEDSATALARTEREGAWREMARQVAHEIKNPLTPMKLSIQYLQKAIDKDAANVRELSSRVAGTLIEQIEHLSRIAAEFSEFANIGNTRNEDLDLHDVLRSLLSLHGMNEKVRIVIDLEEGPVMVHADRTQMNRLFTNLLQNAIESIPESRPGVIRVSSRITAGEVEVTVSDNGTGIPEEMRSRIFTPNFTTKSSGTGLGLAMSKGIVEQCKGSIRFETSSDTGTRFFVRLPLCTETDPPQS